MLQDIKIEFRKVSSPNSYLDEGCTIKRNERYHCIADADTFYVVFSAWTNNQILIITPSSSNYDPDGGTEFMQKEVIKIIETLLPLMEE